MVDSKHFSASTVTREIRQEILLMIIIIMMMMIMIIISNMV